MSEWKKYPENKPERDIVCLVFNSKGWMSDIRAIYHYGYDVFTLRDNNYRENLTLEVTHYLETPEPPRRE